MSGTLGKETWAKQPRPQYYLVFSNWEGQTFPRVEQLSHTDPPPMADAPLSRPWLRLVALLPVLVALGSGAVWVGTWRSGVQSATGARHGAGRGALWGNCGPSSTGRSGLGCCASSR